MKYTGIAAVCLLLLALLPASCIKDDYAAKEKATVTMTFTTRAISGNSATTADVLEPNEHMHTLRVIVARSADSEILYNVRYDIEEEATSKSVTFSELTVNAEGENFDFYAIANEEAVGYTGNWDAVSIETLKGMSLSSAFLTAANSDTNTAYIPQTGHTTILVKPQDGGGIQSATLPLDFVVAKVRLTITNTSSGDQYVNNIKLSGLNMTSTPLFVGESLSTEEQGELPLGNMTIPANESATVYAYFFENTGGNYTLAANWNEEKNLSFGSGTKYNISFIPRGTELDINIKLNATTTPTFNIEVVPWEEVNVDVPPFQ